MHATLVPLHQPAAQNEPRNAGKANPSDAPPRSRAPATQRRRLTRLFSPRPSDLKPTRKIRSKAHRILTLRSRSGGPDPNIMVRPVTFAKEPLSFSRFNPQSNTSQKKLQFGPETCTKPPGFSQNRTRRPGLVFLRVRPQSFSLIML